MRFGEIYTFLSLYLDPFSSVAVCQTLNAVNPLGCVPFFTVREDYFHISYGLRAQHVFPACTDNATEERCMITHWIRPPITITYNSSIEPALRLWFHLSRRVMLIRAGKSASVVVLLPSRCPMFFIHARIHHGNPE